MMGVLLPIGIILTTLGLGGTAVAWYQSGALILAPLSGLSLAIGLVCVGIGAGHWRHPIPSNVRPANPWSDQPYEHGDPPKGLV